MQNNAEEKVKKFEEIAFDLDAKLPTRIWVEGDGVFYGDFQGNAGQRVRISPYEMIQLVHTAGVAARRMISI